MDRLNGMDEEAPRRNTDYLEGLRAAVSHGVAYGIEVSAAGTGQAPPVPFSLLTQAHVAARYELSIDWMIRRYIAAKTVFVDFMFKAAAFVGCSLSAVQHTMVSLGAAFDRLLATVVSEYEAEQQRRRGSDSQLADQTRRLLAGELVAPCTLE
jgi:hypothetical protein